MPLVVVGLILVILKGLDIEPVSAMEWKFTVVPFVAAAIWWKFADATGMTRRQEERKIERRLEERRRKQMESLGTGSADRRSDDRREP